MLESTDEGKTQDCLALVFQFTGVDQGFFPDLSSNANWYDMKVLRSTKKDAKTKIAYAAQNASIHHAFKHTVPPLDQIRRMGRWDSESLKSRDLTHFYREATRICNGFPGRKGGFWLAHDGPAIATKAKKPVITDFKINYFL
ncbi:hypothetical protein [Parasitella parasitica]|uniref:Ndc10 domain-containing protein n=1 Tax=Parasitella parasitica TaxID=35722 RepID=A0A0B7N3Z4_9FUNG|nr:hypothetical protein [Parasitella parasitica]